METIPSIHQSLGWVCNNAWSVLKLQSIVRNLSFIFFNKWQWNKWRCFICRNSWDLHTLWFHVLNKNAIFVGRVPKICKLIHFSFNFFFFFFHSILISYRHRNVNCVSKSWIYSWDKKQVFFIFNYHISFFVMLL